MSAIANFGSSSSLSDVAHLLSNSPSQTSAGTAQAGQSGASNPSTATATSALGSGPAAFVTLSEQAKAAAVARAKSDQAAAESLQAYVEAHRLGGTGNGAKASQSADAQFPDAQPTASGSKVEAIVAHITAATDASEPPPFQPFTPTRNLSNSVTVDGYTLTLDTNAGTQFYGFNLSGNGVDLVNDHFGPSAGFGGGRSPPPGVTISGQYSIDNNEAEESITITTNVASAASASASSSTGSVSESSVSAQSSSITFEINYATGQISARETAVAVSAQSTQVSRPGSTLSTLA